MMHKIDSHGRLLNSKLLHSPSSQSYSKIVLIKLQLVCKAYVRQAYDGLDNFTTTTTFKYKYFLEQIEKIIISPTTINSTCSEGIVIY